MKDNDRDDHEFDDDECEGDKLHLILNHYHQLLRNLETLAMTDQQIVSSITALTILALQAVAPEALSDHDRRLRMMTLDNLRTQRRQTNQGVRAARKTDTHPTSGR